MHHFLQRRAHGLASNVLVTTSQSFSRHQVQANWSHQSDVVIDSGTVSTRLFGKLETERSQAVLERSRRDETVSHHGFFHGRRPAPKQRSNATLCPVDEIPSVRGRERHIGPPQPFSSQSVNTPFKKQKKRVILSVCVGYRGGQGFQTIVTSLFNRRHLTCETCCSSFVRRPEVLHLCLSTRRLLPRCLSSPGLLLSPGLLRRDHFCRDLAPS